MLYKETIHGRHILLDILAWITLYFCQNSNFTENNVTYIKMSFNQSILLLLQPNTDRLQRVEDYVRGYITSSEY